MSLQTAKEAIYIQDFHAWLDQDDEVWLQELRQRSYDYFIDKDYPTLDDEEWKYTSVTPIKNGRWTAVKKTRTSSRPTESCLELLKGFNFQRNGFTALNLAFANLIFVSIPKETSLDKPIEFEFSTAEGTANFPHVIVIAEAGSKAVLIEKYDSGGKSFTNAAIQVFVEDNANLTHYRVQKESAEAFHIGTTEVTLGRGSRYDSTNINLGGAIARHDVHVKFTAEGAECFVDGLYMLGGTQHADTHSTIDHTVPNCISHQTYKGILDGKSRGVFNGKVFVRENANGTDAQQSNKNLLLSNDARVDTKPQLEIFNDDVKCAHGATVGQLEDEELFYLLSRGISRDLARNLLTYGFAEEIINKIGIETIKKDLDRAVLNRLQADLEA